MPELALQFTPTPNLLPSLCAVPPDNPPAPSKPRFTTTTHDLPGVAIPPIIDPATWEDYAIFRETGLMYVTEPTFNTALRTVGEMLFSMILESYDSWPAWTESPTRTELRAAIADLRHLEGFLGSVGREHRLSSLSSEDTTLSQSAARIAVEVGKLADRIEHELTATDHREK